MVFWLALGPGLRMYLDARSPAIIEDLKLKSDGNLLLDSISGDFWNGIKVEKLVVYTDKTLAYLPLITADEIVARLSLTRLFQGDFTPASIHIAGFNAALHMEPDGTLALPQWTISINEDHTKLLHAGYPAPSGSISDIDITCENGILEIHKRFSSLPESVDVVFTDLVGSGNFKPDEGFEIESLEGDYLSTPVLVEGFIPADENEPVDITATIGDVAFNTIFRDIDPLFRGNQYLPEGITSGSINLSGAMEELSVSGNMILTDASLGNVKVDQATALITYNAGVIDLSQGVIRAYGGEANATGRINLLSENPIWSVVCTFQELDLPSYLEQNGYFSNEMTGNFTGAIEAGGDFTNPDSLECTVEIACVDGIYRSPFSDRFMNLTRGIIDESTVSEADMTEFSDLTIRAMISHSNIQVESFHFVSGDLQIESNGVVGFNKSINASGGMSVPLDRARQHPDFGRYVNFLPDSLNRVSLEFTLSGFIYDLKFSASPTDNLLRGLLDQGSDLLHDLGGSFTPVN